MIKMRGLEFSMKTLIVIIMALIILVVFTTIVFKFQGEIFGLNFPDICDLTTLC